MKTKASNDAFWSIFQPKSGRFFASGSATGVELVNPSINVLFYL